METFNLLFSNQVYHFGGKIIGAQTFSAGTHYTTLGQHPTESVPIKPERQISACPQIIGTYKDGCLYMVKKFIRKYMFFLRCSEKLLLPASIEKIYKSQQVKHSLISLNTLLSMTSKTPFVDKIRVIQRPGVYLHLLNLNLDAKFCHKVQSIKKFKQISPKLNCGFFLAKNLLNKFEVHDCLSHQNLLTNQQS